MPGCVYDLFWRGGGGGGGGGGGKVVSDECFMKMKTSRHEQLVLHHPADGFVDSETENCIKTV